MPYTKSGIKPKPCRNGCGANIYFDERSAVGKTADGRWVPLLWNDDQDIGTDEPHQCPKSKYAQQQQQQQNGEIIKGPMPTSGPRDWEEKLGLLNSQIFARLDRIDFSVKQIARAMDELNAYFKQQAKAEMDELAYDQDKEDGIAPS